MWTKSPTHEEEYGNCGQNMAGRNDRRSISLEAVIGENRVLVGADVEIPV